MFPILFLVIILLDNRQDTMASQEVKILNRCCIPKDRVHKVAIICGDAKRFEVFKSVSQNYREFGQYLCWKAAEFEKDGEMILLACHGVGTAPCVTLVRELIELGVKCIIRSGTCGTYWGKKYGVGDICVVYAGIRGDSCTTKEISLPYPAVADPDVVEAIRQASETEKVETHMGISYSTDHFYRKVFHRGEIRDAYINAGVAIEETENAALFTICSLYNVRAGALCTIDGVPTEWGAPGSYDPHGQKMQNAKHNMVRVATVAAANMSRLIKAEEAA